MRSGRTNQKTIPKPFSLHHNSIAERLETALSVPPAFGDYGSSQRARSRDRRFGPSTPANPTALDDALARLAVRRLETGRRALSEIGIDRIGIGRDVLFRGLDDLETAVGL